jgi:hypothetical protein
MCKHQQSTPKRNKRRRGKRKRSRRLKRTFWSQARWRHTSSRDRFLETSQVTRNRSSKFSRMCQTTTLRIPAIHKHLKNGLNHSAYKIALIVWRPPTPYSLAASSKLSRSTAVTVPFVCSKSKRKKGWKSHQPNPQLAAEELDCRTRLNFLFWSGSTQAMTSTEATTTCILTSKPQGQVKLELSSTVG